MSLKASALKSNESQKRALSKEITCILGRLDDEIKLAHERGKNELVSTVPTIFPIPYMRNSDAQRFIYSKVLTSLLGRGYFVEIDIKDSAALLEIYWLSEEERNELNEQTMLLAKHTKKNKILKDLD